MYLIYFWIYRISFDDEVWINCTWIGREIRKVIVKSGDFKVIQVVRTQSRFRSHWNPSECKHLIGDSRRCRDWVKKKSVVYSIWLPPKKEVFILKVIIITKPLNIDAKRMSIYEQKKDESETIVKVRSFFD